MNRGEIFKYSLRGQRPRNSVPATEHHICEGVKRARILHMTGIRQWRIVRQMTWNGIGQL